jgi:rRNA biogenesis protein RRP5
LVPLPFLPPTTLLFSRFSPPNEASQEIKLGEEDKVRELYERAVSLSLSTKKMKFMLKRYLKFEQEHGNEERVEKIKEKAMAYVMSKQ